MRRMIDWIAGHPWQTATGVLTVALVGSVVALATSGETPESEAIPATTTTVASDVETTPTTLAEDDTLVTTTAPAAGGPSDVTAVVVDNVPDTGLQVGIDSAELLIETPVEGGLTRFTAFYGSHLPNLVGPVRSLRPVSADILALFSPVVFTTGGQPFVTGAVEAAGTTIVSADQDTFAFQSLERPQPHHLFVAPGVEVAPGSGIEAPWAEGAWPGGDDVGEITLAISGGVTWRFEDGAYTRYTGDGAHEVLPGIDEAAVPLTRETLIILVAHQRSAGYTDAAGADVPTFDIVGSGDLYLLHGGELIAGTWSRGNQSADYVFSSDTGESVAIPSGSTYLAIVPEGLEVGIPG